MGRIIIQSMCNIPTLMSRNAKRATAGSSCATMVEAAASSQRRRQSLPQIQPPALRRRKQRRRSASQCELRETQCGHLPSLKTPERLPTKVQIPRKLFNLVKAIFNEHDHDRDGFITEEEFVAAVTRADERKAEQEAERIKRRFHDKNVGETVGALAAQRSVMGTKARKQHASAMFQSASRHKTPQNAGQLSLLDFVAMYFPHLPRAAVRHACEKYAEKPVPAPPKKTLANVVGAKEEIQQIFEGLQTAQTAMGVDSNGVVRVKSLAPLMFKLGITEKDVEGWLSELPPALYRAQGELGKGSALCRMKSTLNLQDMERLLAPLFMPKSPKAPSKECILKQIEFNKDLALDAIYGH